MTAGRTISKKYISKCINCIRWTPTSSGIANPETFVTGSWGNDTNAVGLWEYSSDAEPVQLDAAEHTGHVNSLTFISNNTFATGGSSGDVNIYQHDGRTIKLAQSWHKRHSLESGVGTSCNSVSSNGSTIASVGNDSNIYILNPAAEKPVRVIGSGTSTGEYASCWVRNSCLLTANMHGQLRLWDTAAKADSPTHTISACDEGTQDWIRVLQPQPTQTHVVVAAGSAGTLTFWDLRSLKNPSACIAGHNGPITDAAFHPDCPAQLFTTALDGQLLHWDAGTASWLSDSVSRGDVDVSTVISNPCFPVNACTVTGNVLLAAADDQSIYAVRNVVLC